MNNMPAITGWTWLKEGTGLFRKQPASLTTLLFANILISLLISAIPFIGPMLTVVLIGSSQSRIVQRGEGPRLYTPRGYARKVPA